VIYFAREVALHAGANSVDSTHILSGLLMEESTRANRLFHLSGRFPEETAKLRALKNFAQPKDIPLAKDSKRILAYTAEEANQLDDYWIDTDHLLLGILCERSSSGAVRLKSVGIEIDEARRAVAADMAREDFGPIPVLWWLERPITRIGQWASLFYILGIICLIRIVTERSC
jgi:ATP-dependent Clp protease ATP-binding subunit ClpC